MELWSKARSFAEETAKRSQELTLGASKLSDIIAETSKEIAAQASKRADQLRAEAIKRADQIKHLAEGATAKNPSESSPRVGTQSQPQDHDLHTFGITDELREFVTGITVTTFRDFPLQGPFYYYYYYFVFFVLAFAIGGLGLRALMKASSILMRWCTLLKEEWNEIDLC